MKKYQDGKWHVWEEVTRKPLERLRIDATRALMQGLSGLVTTHEWNRDQLVVSSLGSNGTLDFDHGRIICRLCFSFPATLPFIRNKILSDVEAAVKEVSGVVDPGNKNVFVVHGHDLEAKGALRDFLVKLGLNPIILDEQDDRGMTLIEKFEYYAGVCSFAFILVTPDDQMSASDRSDKAAMWHARQNVIMELGWFIAHLGRERVAILYRAGAEIPSDIHGVLYARFGRSVSEVSEKIRQRLKGVTLIE